MQIFLYIYAVAVLGFIFNAANIGVAQIPADASIEEIVSKASEQRKIYTEEFKNLLSEETKHFEIYGKNGEIKKRRAVKSTFIVYQLSKDDKLVAEYRNVISVDGKNLDNTDKRAQDFFEKIVEVESSNKELEKLFDEGSRYDQDISLGLFTLYQAVALADNLRPYFDFKLEGTERIDNNEVYVISYRQLRPSPYIIAGGGREPADGGLVLKYDIDEKGDLNGRLKGKLWIDKNTFQVWRENRIMNLQPEGFAAPVILAENVFEFQNSGFTILTPKKITHTQYELKRKNLISIKEARVTFEYDKFTKPDVEVKSGEVK
ncbi:MAG: hypothetical protein H7070_03425 [Saprospiraceae bacterium]|nr:hypothetical protein [Pyrinomonadaceae bacterium]